MFTRIVLSLIIGFSSLALSFPAWAQGTDDALEVCLRRNTESLEAQNKIDAKENTKIRPLIMNRLMDHFRESIIQDVVPTYRDKSIAEKTALANFQTYIWMIQPEPGQKYINCNGLKQQFDSERTTLSSVPHPEFDMAVKILKLVCP